MPCQILISNNSGIPRGVIVNIVDHNHKWSTKESMVEFVNSGGRPAQWSRKFSIVKVNDKNASELTYLTEVRSNVSPRWRFCEPPPSTSEWQELYEKGEVSRGWSIIEQYLVENN